MSNLYDLTFFDIYEKNSIRFGSKCAVHWNSRDISYKDIFLQTCRLAEGLSLLDLASGSRIAVLCKNHPVFFHLFGAASALDLTLVMINRRLSDDEISYIVEDTTPCVMICDNGMADRAEKLAASYSFMEHCFIVNDFKEKKSVPTVSDSPGVEMASPGMEASDREKCCKDISTLYLNPVKPFKNSGRDNPFIIIHTAAVQGKPRGAVLTEKNIILANMQIINTFGFNSRKSYLNILPLFHIMGINMGLGTFQAGGKNVIVEKFVPRKALELIEQEKINFTGSFPPILTNLIDEIEKNNFDLTSLELAAGLEMPDTVKKWEKAADAKFWTMYGQTETSGLITFAEYFMRPGSAGKISLLANIKITDDFDNFLPAGETGEILVKGPLVFKGYWNADDLNKHTFRGNWHHTGDLGMIDDDGFLFFKGRKAERDLIKPGGENVFPAEVENAILKHDAVKEVCVFGVPDKKFGEGVKAVCSLYTGKSLTKKELIKFTGSLIAGYKKPGYVEFIKELPKTEDGSIDRQLIKKTFPEKS